ncbi:oligosaccharide flippase family protein [Amylibacter sp.]|nr:oligosaccharide flippase family protein [Amylibacter sp.]MDC1532075.1 oligosaccharide flippase family protein [Amylibacter sp.]
MSALLKRNGVYAALFYFISMFLPLILAPYAARVLGADGLGEIAYAQAIFIYFQLLSGLGSGAFGQRLIAKSAKNKSSLSVAFLEIWLLKMILGIIGIFIFVISIRNFDFPLKILLYVQIVDLTINFVDISWFYQGMQNFKKVIIRQLLIKLCTVFCVFLFVQDENDAFMYLLCFSIPTFFGYLLMWKNITEHINFKEIALVKPFRHLKGLFILFTPFVAILLFAYIDRLLIGFITQDMSLVGLYDMSFKFAAISIGLSTAISTVLMPNITSAYADGEFDYIKNTLTKALEVSVFMGMFSFLCFFYVSPYLIPWFLGSEFAASIEILKILSFVVYFKSITILLGSGLMIAIERDKTYVIFIWISLLLNIGLNILLIPNFGATGAATASAMSEILLVITLIIFNRNFISNQLLKIFGIYTISVIPVIIFMYYFNTQIEATITNTILILFYVTFIYCAILIVLFKRLYVFHLIIDVLRRKIKND